MRVYFLSLRRAFNVIFLFLLLIGSAFSQSAKQLVRAQNIANHFAAIKTMTGDFIQFSPKGKITKGTFYLERPGKIRFSYKGVPLQIVADGKSVGVNNRALNTWSFYQLSQTPMKLLLGDTISLSSANLLAFREDPGAVMIVLRDKTIGKGQIKMIFDSQSYALRQWTILDQQNLETTVQVMNVRTNVRFADGMFKIPYKNTVMSRSRNNN
ncbi:lipoprotein carrier protein [Bartonella clarridgeiae 73]|uniref:Lipoprotein carrier protein n=1 Tax=Bartonella clarridgeiae (strain CCUG 45776 / CIP 104772 / 73) TaxID=696125 RepID=E6YJC7_BARC7|nr:outer membrane lipoprotein carrier protein LolA [Bartonella clarridgeiae]WCR55799.1 MAG: Outer membrane lipoprotein carrier protein LolA [Bartonella clarridgeiae]CBI76965.1 lipoprotein carrier protein [Bartonella clarridgeiae 73]